MNMILCIIIFLLGITLLGISWFKHKSELVVNYILRIVLGVVGIYTINTILKLNHIEQLVGLNGLNVLTVGILGLPGFALVYSLGIYYTFRV